jgi:hypothetical protein
MNARYFVGQSVEVFTADFTIPGFPSLWMAAIVTEVSRRDDGKFDIMTRTPAGAFHPQIVGKRGGNRNLREVA